jgi:Fe2+ or Zn2+ uptake regulation protein
MARLTMKRAAIRWSLVSPLQTIITHDICDSETVVREQHAASARLRAAVRLEISPSTIYRKLQAWEEKR